MADVTSSEHTSDPVVDAAHRLLDREGPTALSVRRVAAEAGIAPMTIYNRFDSKDGLVDLVIREGFEELRARIAAADARGDLVARLHACAAVYREVALERPQIYAVMFERAIPDYRPSPTCLAVAADTLSVLVAQIAEGQRGGIVVQGDPAEIAERLWALLHGLVALELHGMGVVTDRGAHFAAAVGTLIRGLLA